jgi:hypothetical protein
MNHRLIATRVGDAIKYSSSLNEIDRLALSHFRFERQDFPNSAITSARAQRVYDWILTLGRQMMGPSERESLLVNFRRGLVGPDDRAAIDDGPGMEWVIETIKPARILPVHTQKLSWFEARWPEKVVLARYRESVRFD